MQLVFIGGMGRSGTNLLRSMLDCHSQIASGPEFDPLEATINLYRLVQSKRAAKRIDVYVTKDSIDRSFGDLIRSYFDEYVRAKGKRMLVEKTPSNIWNFDVLTEIFPDAKFIHVVRDGRDVACSHLEVGQRYLESNTDITKPDSSPLVSPLVCGILWTETVQRGMQICGPESTLFRQGRCLTVRYADLVFHTERELSRICNLLGIEFEKTMLHPERCPHDVVVDGLWVTKEKYFRPVAVSSIQRWRKDMDLRSRVLFSIKGQVGLKLLGYEENNDWIVEGLTTSPEEIRKQTEAIRAEVAALERAKRSGG
jgi:hypothetical protein